MTNLRAFLLATVAAIGALAISAGAASADCPLPGSADASLNGSPQNFEGTFTADQRGSFVQLPFEVAPGTTGMRIRYCYDSSNTPGNTDAGTTLDMGVYEPLTGGDTEWGMKESRGWSGSAVKNLGIAVNGFTDTATYNTSRKAYVSGKTTRAFRPGPIQEGIWAVELGLGWLPSATDDPDGIHWEVEVQTTTDSSWSNTPYVPDNYAPYVANPSAGWYDGDFHTHGEQEPGNAPMDQTFAKGFGAGPTGNALDFMTLVDHNNMVARGEIGRYDQAYPGKLIVPGTEVTTYKGHWNSQNAGQLADFRSGPVLRFYDVDTDNQVEAGELGQVRASLDPSTQFAASSASGGWAQINHPTIFQTVPAQCRGCFWEYTDAQTDYSKVDAIEVSTGTAAFPGNMNPASTAPNPFLAGAISFYQHALSTGAHIAAVASSDDHQGGDAVGITDSQVGRGATAVYASELSQSAITAAVKADHTYAKPFGADAPDVTMTASSPGKADAIPGDSITAPSAQIAVNVKNAGAAAARPGSYLLEILKDGISVDSAAISSDDFNHTYTATESGRYSFQVSRTPGASKLIEAYSSPVWFTQLDDPVPPTPTAKVSKVSVSGPAKVKKGKKATYKVRITNSGKASATGVKLKVSGKGVSAKSSAGTVAAGKTKTVKVKLKPKKPGKVKLTFKVTSANAGGKSVKKTIKVRK